MAAMNFRGDGKKRAEMLTVCAIASNKLWESNQAIGKKITEFGNAILKDSVNEHEAQETRLKVATRWSWAFFVVGCLISVVAKYFESTKF